MNKHKENIVDVSMLYISCRAGLMLYVDMRPAKHYKNEVGLVKKLTGSLY